MSASEAFKKDRRNNIEVIQNHRMASICKSDFLRTMHLCNTQLPQHLQALRLPGRPANMYFAP